VLNLRLFFPLRRRLNELKDLWFKDIDTTSRLIKRKEISPVELTQSLLQRIERLEPQLNAFIRVMEKDALEQAQVLQDEWLAGKWRGPLHGVPIAIKDIFETKGSVTTGGSKLLAEWVPAQDATVVARLKEAGAVIIGKTNLHEFAMGATTENPHYGPTRNPWNLSRIPGGSSGGAAAAVAAGMCFGALGTDTGGSIRLPSALCGIVGLKPTYGRVSRHGCLPLSWSLDHIGPMTRTVRDSAIMLQVLAGVDPLDDSSSAQPVDPYLAKPLENLQGIRVGICEEYFFEDMDPEMKHIVHEAILQLHALGAEIVRIRLDHLTEALTAQRTISMAEGFTFHEAMFAKSPEIYGEDLRVRFQKGKSISASSYLHAQQMRKKMIHHVLEQMHTCDMLVAPTNAMPPFEIGTMTPENTVHNIFRLGKTPLGNLLGFPALTVPCGFTSEHLPVGLQLIGKPFTENALMQVGDLYEQSTDWALEFGRNPVLEQSIQKM
jgi:aspartyl-tRNA(Asn)/glutamyl-tRNA(Gln) amidotransferase subunit A